jgi:hypothetical protein
MKAVLTSLELNPNAPKCTIPKYFDDSPKLVQESRIYQLFLELNQDVFKQLKPKESFDWQNNQNAFQRLKCLSELPEKWDGYSAPTFPRHQINRSIEIFQSIQDYSRKHNIDWRKLEPFIAPSSDGNILFEWSGQRFNHRTLEIYVPQELDFSLEYLKTDIRLDSDTEGECQTNQVSDLLDWLLII